MTARINGPAFRDAGSVSCFLLWSLNLSPSCFRAWGKWSDSFTPLLMLPLRHPELVTEYLERETENVDSRNRSRPNLWCYNTVVPYHRGSIIKSIVGHIHHLQYVEHDCMMLLILDRLEQAKEKASEHLVWDGTGWHLSSVGLEISLETRFEKRGQDSDFFLESHLTVRPLMSSSSGSSGSLIHCYEQNRKMLQQVWAALFLVFFSKVLIPFQKDINTRLKKKHKHMWSACKHQIHQTAGSTIIRYLTGVKSRGWQTVMYDCMCSQQIHRILL